MEKEGPFKRRSPFFSRSRGRLPLPLRLSLLHFCVPLPSSTTLLLIRFLLPSDHLSLRSSPPLSPPPPHKRPHPHTPSLPPLPPQIDSESGLVGLVLDRTSFYAESGGQVCDLGTITTASGANFTVSDVQKFGAFIAHIGHVSEGELCLGDELTLSVDYARRAPIARNHTSTHMLNLALREALGVDADQRGSLCDADKLRFDFAYGKPLTGEQLAAAQEAVNRQIKADMAVHTQVRGGRAAGRKGAWGSVGRGCGRPGMLAAAGMGDGAHGSVCPSPSPNTAPHGPITPPPPRPFYCGRDRLASCSPRLTFPSDPPRPPLPSRPSTPRRWCLSTPPRPSTVSAPSLASSTPTPCGWSPWAARAWQR